MNTLWRARPFQALAREVSVLGLAPQDVVAAWRTRGQKGRLAHVAAEHPGLTVLPVLLPPGWASRLSGVTAPYLWWKICREAQQQRGKLQALVVTSPHYLDLVKNAGARVRTFYYCSDDYAQYADWGGDAILEKEAELAQRADHSFFVSQPLAERAVEDYGLEPDRVSVSPNATDEMFFQAPEEERESALLKAYPALKRPLLGVVGAINSRLDFELIEACCNLPSVGSVVMVGPVDGRCQDAALERLRRNPRCVFVGAQPHDSLPVWMQVLDVALIPYRDTALNRSCSPMRLFDHLAAGKPVVATAGCPQVRLFEPLVKVGNNAEECTGLVQTVLNEESASVTEAMRRREMRQQAAREHTWASRSHRLHETMKRYF